MIFVTYGNKILVQSLILVPTNTMRAFLFIYKNGVIISHERERETLQTERQANYNKLKTIFFTNLQKLECQEVRYYYAIKLSGKQGVMLVGAAPRKHLLLI